MNISDAIIYFALYDEIKNVITLNIGKQYYFIFTLIIKQKKDSIEVRRSLHCCSDLEPYTCEVLVFC